ncbi:hypothetical protein C8J57DRAFT_638442 [Mycena rebaudengoi]|nr:hypothetical protein C8J57DRAFT_638442 [Mycena rebaudengoi]
MWWREGLSTSVLCDACGTNWRKYADLSVWPVREESLPATTKLPKTVEKREGTPLAGPVSRRAKTSAFAHSTPPPQASVATQIRCLKNGEGSEVQAMRVPGSRYFLRWWAQNLSPRGYARNSCLLCLREG